MVFARLAMGSHRAKAHRAYALARGVLARDVVRVTTIGTPVSIVAMANHRSLPGRIGGRMDSQHPVDAADEPANHTTDDSPDRPGCLAAHIGPMRGPVRNALRLRRQRAAQQRGNNNARVQMMWFHDRASLLVLKSWR